jgi:indolepyruvate ferredoxin oxidoreductase
MDERFLKEEGAEVFTGNELILKGALEAECALITGYPGSPVSDVFDTAFANRELLKKHGILAEMANNEALAVARLNGSRMAGVRAMAVMKSVGLHVAADGLALGNLSEPYNDGGSIVVVGDDPWIESTQINNDSRYLSQHLHMPVLEPATFQEMKDWVGTAFELSARANLYITYLVTTNQADGGGTVWVRPNRYPTINTKSPIPIETGKIDLDTNVLLPPRTWAREVSLPARFRKLIEEARERQLNVLKIPSPPAGGEGVGEGGKFPVGFISSGLPYCYLEHALTELGLSGRFPILKLGLTYPVDPEIVLKLTQQVHAIFVIEEKRGFIESQILQILNDARQASPHPAAAAAAPSPTRGEGILVWGKKFPQGLAGIPEERGLNASLLMERLIPFLQKGDVPLTENERLRLRREEAILEATAHVQIQLPTRTPTFCPGCPHRDSSSVFLQIKKDFSDPAYMKRVHGRAPADLLFHGETGCFTMLMFEPNKPLMHNYSGMGLGGGTGAGADPFITNKQVVFLGDSTFFHSGMIAISDSIKAGQDITYIILDNKTTAMTGHQPTPATETNLMGEKTFAQSIEAIVSAMGRLPAGRQGAGIPVRRVNPGYRDRYRELLEETILQDGVKIIIADKECGLTYQRRVRKEKKQRLRQQGYLPEERLINITPEVCEYCLECTNVTGCPGLGIEETLYGPKIVTDLSHCVSDGACAKVKACPSFEEVLIKRSASLRQKPSLPFSGDLPVPSKILFDDRWSAYTAGVGGQGAGVVSAVLVRAAHLEGYRVLFSDKKGLAIRNGGVYGHVIISRTGGVLSPLVPYGKADLLLGIDFLEAARAVDPKTHARVLHPERTRAVVNTAMSPTVLMLMGKNAASTTGDEAALKACLRPDGYWGEDLSSLSEQYFGSKLYANMLLLGAAFQLGHLPFSLKSLEEAVRQSVTSDDRSVNFEAFRAGRALAAAPEAFHLARKGHTFSTLLEEKVRYLTETHDSWTARDYRVLAEESALELNLDDDAHRDLALRIYDLIQYEGLELAERYVSLVLATRRKDRREWNFAATKAVMRYAFKVMAIKDEVYVAHLLTSPEKRARDRARYRIDEANGDRLRYRHLNRPEFTVFGKSFQWDMVTRDWQLKIVKRLKFLRKILPSWHRLEKDFRDWYLSLASHFDAEDEKSYAVWVQILEAPEEIRGFRAIRQPKMDEARQKVKTLLMLSGEKSLAESRAELSVFCGGPLR